MAEGEGPYTTIKVEEYNRMASVITQLRWTRQKARELLEQNRVDEAKKLLITVTLQGRTKDGEVVYCAK